jgi:hypothetical protein
VKVGEANGAKLAATNAVEAALVLLSPAVGVGTVTVPVKVGEAFVAILATLTSVAVPDKSYVIVSTLTFP